MNKKPESNSKASLLSSLGSAVTIIVTLFGLFIGYKKFIEESPSLLIQVEKVELKGFVHPDTILYELDEIEQQYGIATGDRILQLKREITKMHTSFLDSTKVIGIMASIYNRIRFFQMPSRPWTYDEITYKNGIIRWPDGYSYDASKDKDAVTILGVPKDSLSLVNLKMRAYSLYQPFDKETRESVAKKLRSIIAKLRKLSEHQNHFLELQLHVINKSTQANFLAHSAKYYISSRNHASAKGNELYLTFSNETVISGRSEAHMTLRSKTSHDLKSSIDLHKIFREKEDYFIKLKLWDVDNHSWSDSSVLNVKYGQTEIKDYVSNGASRKSEEE